MPFIDTTSPAEASGSVREMYARQQAKYGYVPSYAKVFSHRPEILELWADLQRGIRKHLDNRRFELVTVAAAMSIRSTACSLAHGRALTKFHSPAETRAIVSGAEDSPLTEAEKAMMRFAQKIARNASSVTADDVATLKTHGFGDAEIFDIAAAATARTFFAQLCEGLGADADPVYGDFDPALREALTVGRPIGVAAPERLG